MDAVRPVHVDNARHASEFFDAVPVKRGVRRRIVETEIRFGFDDAARYPAILRIVNQHLPDQRSSDLRRRPREPISSGTHR